MSTIASTTPNVVVQNPAVRKVAGVVLGIAGILLPVLLAVDAATEAFDLAAFTTPALAGVSALAGVFGLSVTVPNVPSGGSIAAGTTEEPDSEEDDDFGDLDIVETEAP